MANRKLSKKLKAWIKDYTETFHGIEPSMDYDEMIEGIVTREQYKRRNLNWIADHTAEQVRRLERL